MIFIAALLLILLALAINLGLTALLVWLGQAHFIALAGGDYSFPTLLWCAVYLGLIIAVWARKTSSKD